MTMQIGQMNWMQVEAYLAQDDRAVVPLGSTEQHSYLSLSVDSILAERVAAEAAEPLGVPVFPVVAYGLTPYFLAYPGTISLRVATYAGIIGDILDSLHTTGFRRILFVNGHGGNSPADTIATEWAAARPEMRIKFHNWWSAPKTWAKAMEIDPIASHASWLENFPWTRLAGVTMPTQQKPLPAPGQVRLTGQALRDHYGDGNFGGYYQRDDAELLAMWQVAVAETRALMAEGWE
jgi:creatinine amidohydrolase